MSCNNFRYITMHPCSNNRRDPGFRPDPPPPPEPHCRPFPPCPPPCPSPCPPEPCCYPYLPYYPCPPCNPWPPFPVKDDHKVDCKLEPPKPPYIPQKLSAIQAQLVDDGGGTIADNSNVIFNTVLKRKGTNITYDIATGEFTLAANKLYYVSWQVATDVENTITNIAFGSSVDGLLGPGTSSPSLVGQISGTALIETDESSQTLALVNRSGGTVTYASNTVQANIVIHELNRYTTVHPF